MASRRFILIAIFAMVLVLTLFFVYEIINITSIVSKLTATSKPITGNIIASAILSSNGTLDYNNGKQIVPYLILDYRTTNASSGVASITMYNKNPSINLYVVNVGSSCYDCFSSESQFSGYLAEDLYNYGVIPNTSDVGYVNLGDLGTLPNNSVLVIPSGLMPSALLTQQPSIFDLLGKGDTVVYIGRNFTRNINNGIVYITDNATLSRLTNALLNTEPTYNISIQYNISNVSFRTPTFAFTNGHNIGPISVVNSGNGSVVALSDYPSYGWNNASSAATDIAYVITNRPWLKVISTGQINTSQSGNQYIFGSPINATPSVAYTINNSYSLFTLDLYNSNGSKRIEIPFNIKYLSGGNVGVQPVVPTSISVPITIGVKNVTTSSLAFHIDIYNQSNEYVSTIPIGPFITSSSIIKQYQFDMAPGYYTLLLRDINGRTYEKALVYVEGFNITPVGLDFSHGNFTFDVQSYGQIVSGIPFSASIDGLYEKNGTINNGVLNYQLPKGSVIGYGTKNFTFDVFGTNYTYSTIYQRQQTIPTFYIEFGIAVFVVILLNLVLRAPVKDEYYIDVPNFPPINKIEMKSDVSTVVSIFDTLNLQYRWRYMPLTPEEIKAGISNNMRYNNMPISITLQNTIEVLDKLTVAGHLESAYNYYMPKKWSEISKHDIEYLVAFRRLRDYCIENAMLFTDLDATANGDMIITKNGVQSTVYLYSPRSGMRDITFKPDSRIFIVFLTQEALQEFQDKLYSSYGQDAELLRMGVSSSMVKLVSMEKPEQLLY